MSKKSLTPKLPEEQLALIQGAYQEVERTASVLDLKKQHLQTLVLMAFNSAGLKQGEYRLDVQTGEFQKQPEKG